MDSQEGIEVRPCEFGRGIFATWHIAKGELILDNDIIIVPKDCVPDYVFKFDKKHDCLCLGMGELFNHSSTPNVKYKLRRLRYHGGRPDEWVMEFIALRNIVDGEQLFIDYRQDSPGLDLSRYGIKE